MDNSEGDDDIQACFPCPFCYVDIKVQMVCSRLQEEHYFDLKKAVCPSCAGNLGKDVIGHFLVQHANPLKIDFSNEDVVLRAGVYIKAFSGNLKKETPKLSLSPCHFKMLAKNKALEIGFDALESHKKHEERNMLKRTSSGAIVKCSTQDEIPDEEKNLGPHD